MSRPAAKDTDTPEEKTKKYALDMLISNDPDGSVKCEMFLPIEWLSDRGKVEIGKADQAEAERVKLEEWQKLYANPRGEHV